MVKLDIEFSFVLLVLFIVVLFGALIYGQSKSVVGSVVSNQKCAGSWICLDSKTRAYENSRCEITIKRPCEGSCNQGACSEGLNIP